MTHKNPCKKYVGPKDGGKACEKCGWSFNSHLGVMTRKKDWMNSKKENPNENQKRS